jgi:hypothetical protein
MNALAACSSPAIARAFAAPRNATASASSSRLGFAAQPRRVSLGNTSSKVVRSSSKGAFTVHAMAAPVKGTKAGSH